MNNVVIQPLIFDEAQIKNLYLDNQWYAYTNDIESLYRGIKNSTQTLGAYIDDQLVGLIRVLSDQETICYIQDILVLMQYHRQSIGTKLMASIIDQYKACRQILLMTDNTEQQKQFYQSCGFISYQEIDCVGFKYIKK